MLRGEFPELLCQPAFAHIQQISDRLRDALAGHSDRPAARIAALVLLAGISEACGEFADIPDDDLRSALLTLVRRAVEPVDAPPPQPTHDRGQGLLMATLLYRLGRGALRRRRLVVALWLVVLVVAGLAAATLRGPTASNFTMPGTE